MNDSAANGRNSRKGWPHTPPDQSCVNNCGQADHGKSWNRATYTKSSPRNPPLKVGRKASAVATSTHALIQPGGELSGVSDDGADIARKPLTLQETGQARARARSPERKAFRYKRCVDRAQGQPP